MPALTFVELDQYPYAPKEIKLELKHLIIIEPIQFADWAAPNVLYDQTIKIMQWRYQSDN